MWAVGFYENLFDSLTMTLHWDGSAWSVVPSPNTNPTYNYLYGVSGTSSDDVWAVGYFHYASDQALAMHWDGTSWDIVAVPVVGSVQTHLYAVWAIAPDDVWAVGKYVDVGIPSQIEHALTMHWDGSMWTHVTSPDGGTESNFLNGVEAISANDVWAVGEYQQSVLNRIKTLTEHWDGSVWSIVPSPSEAGVNWLLG